MIHNNLSHRPPLVYSLAPAPWWSPSPPPSPAPAPPPAAAPVHGLLELRRKVSMPRQGTQRGAGAGREEELEQENLAALQDFLHSKTCVLPPDTFAPALAHQWRGSWLLAA